MPRRTRETVRTPSSNGFSGGLTLREHLELPSTGRIPRGDDDPAVARVRAAVRVWSTEGDDLPSSLDGWSAHSLTEQVAGRARDPDHPTHTDWNWLVRAYSDDDQQFDLAHHDLSHHALWQRQLLALLAPALSQVRSEVSEILAAASPLAAEAGRLWLSTPPPVLLRSLTGAFVVDMQAARRLDPDEDVDNWFERHLATLSDPAEALRFFARYPLLARLSSRILQGWRDAAIEFADRLDRDRDAVATLLGSTGVDLVRVSPGQGDRHRGGRTVARVEFRQGTLAYKPASAAALTCLRSALTRVREQGVPLDLRTPDVLDRGTHTWMTWLDSAPCAEAEVADYYHRLGELNTLAWLLGANDLHAENLVVRDARPWLADVETLLSPAPAHRDAGHAHAAPGILVESPVSTGILPFTVDLGNEISVDMSAFADQPGQLGGEVTTWDDAGTSRMHAVRRRVPQETTGSAVRTPAGPCDPFAHTEDVITGSAAGFAALRRHADTLTEALERELAAAEARVRVVLRNTALYARVTDYLHHPAVLNNPFLAEAAFGLLDPTALHSEPKYQQAVIEAERAALLAGDVPYFETEATGRDLFGPDGLHLPDFFAESAMDRVRARAARVRSDTTAYEWVTGASLRAADLNRRRSRPLRVCCDVAPSAPVTDQDLVTAAGSLADRVAALAHTDSGEVSWLTLRVDTRNDWRLVAADDSLYFGSLGIRLFLEVLAAVQPVSDRVRGLLDQLREQAARSAGIAVDTGGPRGLFDGVAGRLYADTILRGLGAPSTEDPPALLDALDVSITEDDVLTGAAGVVLALVHLAETRSDLAPRALTIAERHVAALLERAVTREHGCTWLFEGTEENLGMAHGSSGIAAALREFARVHSTSPLRERALACASRSLQYESHRFDPNARNWPDLRVLEAKTSDVSHSWCNGSAGVGLARVLSLREPGGETDRLHADLRHALATTLPLDAKTKGGLGLGQSLCHGDLGVSELLLSAGLALADEELLTRARQVGGMVAADLADHDGVATLDFDARLDVPGLLNGSAGIGYQLLRLAHPDVVPSLLLAEVTA